MLFLYKMKISEFISQVRSNNKLLADDNILSDRAIYNIGKNITSTLMKRELNSRKLLNSDNVFFPMECVELCQSTFTECNISCDGFITKTKIKLPLLEEGIYGYSIQGVYNTDNSEEIYPTTIREYINESKLRYKSKQLKYLVKDRYMYILNEDIETINIYLYSIDNSMTLTKCQSMFEAELKIPTYLHMSLFELVDKTLINFLNKRQDITDNNLEE